MSSEICTKCGAEMMAGARFCRRCGQPSRPYDPGSVTEAETRVFQATAERGAPTQYYNPKITGPTYLTPSDTASPPQVTPVSLESDRPKRRGILWGSLALGMILFLFVVVMAVKWTTSPLPTATVTPPTAPPPFVIPKTGEGGGGGGIESPPPPQPPGTRTGNLNELDYPGAVVTMEMTRGNEGGVRQLRTSDSFDQVVAWYTAKLNPSRTLKKGNSAVLTGEKRTAVINGSDSETTVLLTEGIDQ